MANRIWVLLTAVVQGACSVVGIRSGTEEPRYHVVESIAPDVEVRRYEPSLAAEVTVPGEEEAARSTGFRRLAAFIFGDTSDGRTIAMTAPVAQAAADPGQWRVRFTMPAEYSRQTLPAPADPAIAIVELPAATVAAIRFAGVPTVASVHAAGERLHRTLAASRWRATGPPVALFYDPPWTLPPLRRNEVAVAVERAAD